MKKTIISILLLSLALALFTSCAGVVENSNFKTDGYLLIDGEETVPEYILKINGNVISFAEYRYYYLNEKADLDGGDINVWKKYPKYIDILKKYVEESLVEVYSIRALAAENGVQPDFKQVDEQIAEFKSSMTAAEFKEGLSSFNLTEELYRYILQGYELYTSLFNYYFGEDGTRAMTDADMTEYIENNYTHVKHILINPNTTMSDSEYEAHLENILNKARSSEDFDSLVAEYSDDNAMPQYGYYFTDSEMPEEFVLAAKSLEDGEISDLVKTSHGYHIIKKLPVDTTDLDELKDVVYNQIFSEIVDAKIASAKIEYAPEYESIAPETVK